MNISCLYSTPPDPETNRQKQEKFQAAVKKFSQFVFRQELNYTNNGLPATIYRGQTQNWPLLPGILRKNIHTSAHTSNNINTAKQK